LAFRASHRVAMEILFAFTEGWTKASYLITASILVALIIALLAITIATHDWRKRFSSRSEVGTYVLFWLVFALILSLAAVVVVSFVLPTMDGFEWLKDVPVL